MKNKIMERPFFEHTIRQQVKSEMLCLSDIFEAYNEIREEKGWGEKRMSSFFLKSNSENTDFITELVFEADLIKASRIAFMEQVEKIGIIRTLKEHGLYETKGRGDNKAVYCNPYIFIGVAMWINPSFRAKVTVWATDQLIVNRIEAGERFKVLSKAVANHIVPTIDSDAGKKFIYSNFAKLINKKVFGEHKDNLRQLASRQDLVMLRRLQDKVSTLIEVGYISSYAEAKAYIETIEIGEI